MATYKIISKKTGKSRDSLTLKEALSLTKMSSLEFSKAISKGHPSLTIEARMSVGDYILPGLLVLIVAVVGLGWLASATDKEPLIAENCWGHDEVTAHVYAQLEMKKQLKSPRSAKFPHSDFKFRDDGNCTYAVQSYVDSQNGFGALVRTNYTGRVKFTGEDSWDAVITHVETR